MTLGERIKEFRHMEGVSQEGLAEKLNVTRQAVSRWELGVSIPNIEHRYSVDSLFGRRNNSHGK